MDNSIEQFYYSDATIPKDITRVDPRCMVSITLLADKDIFAVVLIRIALL